MNGSSAKTDVRRHSWPERPAAPAPHKTGVFPESLSFEQCVLAALFIRSPFPAKSFASSPSDLYPGTRQIQRHALDGRMPQKPRLSCSPLASRILPENGVETTGRQGVVGPVKHKAVFPRQAATSQAWQRDLLHPALTPEGFIDVEERRGRIKRLSGCITKHLEDGGVKRCASSV